MNRLDTLVTIGALLGAAHLIATMRPQPAWDPSSLPMQTTPDVRRWRHDGEQPVTQRQDGNFFSSISWPEVMALYSH